MNVDIFLRRLKSNSKIKCISVDVVNNETFDYRSHKAISNEDLQSFVSTFRKHAGSNQYLTRDDFNKMLSTKNVSSKTVFLNCFGTRNPYIV